ncbi:MAG: hypothetical protein JHC95_22670 [Solirubrobacteraceae bacterium]|nr:hypothetical protein [Solirubrobacteraceae bacterium]
MDVSATTRMLQLSSLMTDLMSAGGGAIPAQQAAELRRRIDVIAETGHPQPILPPNAGHIIDVYV